MQAVHHYLPNGDPGISATLREMRRLVLASAKNPLVIEWAQSIVRRVPERDTDAEAEAFLQWARMNFRYTKDPVAVELVKTPEAMVREYMKYGRVTGDCDDQVVLVAAGLNIVGAMTRFTVVAAEEMTDEFSHVFLEYESPRRGWTSMDPIVRGTGLGWHPPSYRRLGTYSGTHLEGGTFTPTIYGRGHRFALVVIAGLGIAVFMSRGRRRRR